ncbi:hypothetical protein F3Y22_tig00000329pilonHSYRG00012 [Hibiscus syriacus]|uniref:Reverse transcriptase zinc-binding domain-containing protein n=1 Tax=Hibiscus syriacus TaxID=106335 RepID=A0A6A3D2T7_HIBSY|nr:hypothetical protein F3Y22_tig00000329pilonHSYRG00012 [Hibiscus syriacus]
MRVFGFSFVGDGIRGEMEKMDLGMYFIGKSVRVGVSSEETERLAQVCGCRVGGLSFSYLGILLGADPRKVATCEPIVERFQAKLSGWKSRTLSFARRVTLINSIRDFLWGRENGRRKISRVCWSRVCLPRNKGGAGAINLRAKNRALLAKWGWRYLNESSALWRRIIKAKSGCYDRSLSVFESNQRSSSLVWKGILINWKTEDVFRWMSFAAFRWQEAYLQFANVKLSEMISNRITWIHEERGQFSVKKLSQLLINAEIEDPDFDFGKIWRSGGEEVLCSWCDIRMEDANHMFVGCRLTGKFWASNEENLEFFDGWWDNPASGFLKNYSLSNSLPLLPPEYDCKPRTASKVLLALIIGNVKFCPTL